MRLTGKPGHVFVCAAAMPDGTRIQILAPLIKGAKARTKKSSMTFAKLVLCGRAWTVLYMK